MPRKGAVILAPNHVSFLDPMAAGIGCPRDLYFMARHDLFCNRLFGTLLRWVHAFPLKRSGIDTSAFKIALDKLKEGRAILIFPEGTRSRDGNLQDPQSGIGFLQDASGAPIVPCYIKGSAMALPKAAIFPRFRPIAIYFGKPLKFYEESFCAGSKKERYAKIAAETMAAIRELKDNAD